MSEALRVTLVAMLAASLSVEIRDRILTRLQGRPTD
jgi:hypothetical protein